MLSEQPDGVRELALRGVDAADEHVQHEVHEFGVGEAVPLVARGDQRRDQVVAHVVAAALKQVVGELVELHHRLLDPVALLHQVRGVELPLDPVRPVVEPWGPRELGSRHRRDRQRRVRLAELLDELADGGGPRR